MLDRDLFCGPVLYAVRGAAGAYHKPGNNSPPNIASSIAPSTIIRMASRYPTQATPHTSLRDVTQVGLGVDLDGRMSVSERMRRLCKQIANGGSYAPQDVGAMSERHGIVLGVVASKHESCSTHCTRKPHSPSKMLLSENG